MSRARISPELLAKIRESVSIVDIVGEHVVLRKSGANFTGLCPFHSERSPSFSVSGQKQLYHCYGCKRGGDLFTFVMELHGIGFAEAVEELADRGAVKLPGNWNGEGGETGNAESEAKRRAARDKLATAHKLNRFVAAYYHQLLGRAPEGREYFRRRGVGENEKRAFYVGLAAAAWEGLAQHLVEKKAPLPLAVELGLIRPSTRASAAQLPYYDLFRNRAMFPILDLKGKIAGFGGRTLAASAGSSTGNPVSIPGSMEDAGPKYMNSPESFIFQKSRLAFGLFQAQKHIRESRTVVLVEGYFDVVAMHAAGFQNVVASCGTSLTVDHLTLFKRIADRVIILFDGDKAGISATERAMEIGLDQGLILHGAKMPEGIDPDELLFDQATGRAVEGGKAKMAALLDAASPLLDVRITEEIARAGEGSEARTQALKQVAVWLNRLKDPIGRDVRVEELRQKLQIPGALLAKLVPGSTPGSRPFAPRPNVTSGVRRAPQAKVKGPSVRDKTLLVGLFYGQESVQALDKARGNLPPGVDFTELWEYAPLRSWIQQSIARIPSLEGEKGLPNLQDFKTLVASSDLAGIEDTPLRNWVTEALMADGSVITIEDFRLALDQRLGKIWAYFSQRIRSALAEAESKKDAELQSRLMKDYLDVQRKMKEFTSFYDEA